MKNMKYVFKDNIDVKEYDDFVKNFPSTMFMQLSSWSLVKTSWESSFVGMYNDDKLVCVAMILKRKLFLNKCKLPHNSFLFVIVSWQSCAEGVEVWLSWDVGYIAVMGLEDFFG